MDLHKLLDPFPASAIDWRIGQSGKNASGWWATCLAYLENRAIQDRLDAVCGPGNWMVSFTPWDLGSPGVLCTLSIRTAEGWVAKQDGAEQSDIEPVKGGFSNAMKRAAVQWGIGRYLYQLPKIWAKIHEGGLLKAHLKGKDGPGEWVSWDPPSLPDWALPDAENLERKKEGYRAVAGTQKAGPDPSHVPEPPGFKAILEREKAAAPHKPDRLAPSIPDCPTCGGPMDDVRAGKKNPKAPDFRCADPSCKNEKGYRTGAWVEDEPKPVKAMHSGPGLEQFADVPDALSDSDDIPF
jgi:hypothetical protein